MIDIVHSAVNMTCMDCTHLVLQSRYFSNKPAVLGSITFLHYSVLPDRLNHVTFFINCIIIGLLADI